MAATKCVLRAEQCIGLQQPFVDTIFMEASIAPLLVEGPGAFHPDMQVALPGVTHGPMYLSAVAAGAARGITGTGFGMGD